MTPAPRIGTEFAGYRIDGLLGQGGMGLVYRAEHPRLGSTIALKVMKPELALDEAFRERFVREARAAARIRHPNIIPIYDAGEWHGDLYIAMRYVEGNDLGSMLRKGVALPTEQTYVVGFQIASALDAAHRSGLVHRDVKPENILVEPGPDPDSIPIAYLADLGLTKHVDALSGVTGSGELLGTLDYIAPEQISGSRVDGRADVYSLACVLFECLTGSVPYIRENQAAVLWAHLHDDVPQATTLNPSLPSAVDMTLARGMAKVPEDRFSTARELVEKLQPALEAAPAVDRDGAATRVLPTGPPGAPRPAAPAVQPRGRGRALAIALAVGVGVLLGGAGAAGLALLLAGGEKSASGTTSGGATVVSTGSAALTPFDEALLRYVPDELRDSCRHAQPLTSDFDATVLCRPGGVVSSLTYSHARSGFLLYDYFRSRIDAAGLPSTSPPTPTGLCSAGAIPSVNTSIAEGLSGRLEVTREVTRDERLGYVLCYRREQGYRIEWMTSEVGVHTVATGAELGPLYQWWSKDAGPEP
jgi:serine/threonine-protein kinase